jgi:phosphoribosylanthranilate isomerase
VAVKCGDNTSPARIIGPSGRLSRETSGIASYSPEVPRLQLLTTQRIATLFKIKICGIKSVKDAHLVGLAGADAIGLNFYDQSQRYVDVETAEKLVAVLRPNVKRVGLFVNATADTINQAAEKLQLDYIQLHGDEPPSLLGELGEKPIIRAFRFGVDGADELGRFLEGFGGGRFPDAILLDASKPGEYGGTGELADWDAIASAKSLLGEIPLVLAGGLTPFNVAEAIGKVQPAAVDTASGVESQPGSKDPMLLRAYVNAAKKAFGGL